MGVVGDRVGSIDDLRLQERCRRRAVLLPRGLGVEHFARKIQSREMRVADLQQFHDPECLRVVVEATFVGEEFRERVLAGMPQGRVADVMRERQRLDQIFVESQAAGERPGNARHLQRVGEPAAVIVAMVAGEDLCLVRKATERG